LPKYAYVATRPDGLPSSGVHKARSRDAAELALYELEMRDIKLTEKRGLLKAELSAPRVKREEVMHLSRQLGAFIRAGLPLLDAVHTLGEEANNSSIRRMMFEVEEGLRGGDKLSDCFDRHPRIFPEFYRGILRSAELTGQLDTVLDQLAKYLERDLEARRKIKAASIYPSMIILMSLVTVVVLASFVLPRFKVFFASLNAKLPLPTRMLLAVTDFFTQWWWAVLAGVIAVTVSVAVAVRTEPGRYARDRVLLSLPVIGGTIRFALVERFCRILSSMAGAGVPLPEALRVATESLRNLVFMRALAHAGEAMLEGEGLAGPLASTGMFPGTAARMMRVGEETGTLETQLEVTARYYEGELDYKLKKLTALFEPAVIIVMGGLVGFVAVALVSAMYGIFSQVQV
jgi:type IV pilus assembly protein PilC